MNQGYSRYSPYRPNRPHGPKNSKKQQFSDFQQPVVRSNDDSIPNNNNEFLTYIGNIQPNKLKPNELNSLIDGCLNYLADNPHNQHPIDINSVTTFSDAVYLSFKSEQDAIDAANYFHGLQFGHDALESFYFDRCLAINFVNGRKSADCEDTSGYYNRYHHGQTNTELEVLVSNRQLKKYADSVNDKINKELFGIKSFVKYVNKTGSVESEELVNMELVRDAMDRNLLFIIYIDQSSEQFNSINLIIVNKWRLNRSIGSTSNTSHTIKENRNMPLNKAIELLKSEYHDYIGYLKDAYINKQPEDETSPHQSINEDDYLIVTGKRKTVFDTVLAKFIDKDRLTIPDIDFLITYLSRQKKELVDEGFNNKETEGQQPDELPIRPLLPTIPPLLPPYQQAPPLMSLGAPSLMSLNTSNRASFNPNAYSKFNINNRFQ